MKGRKLERAYWRYGYHSLSRILIRREYAEKDEETKCNAFQLRQFDPVIGRWTTTDPYGQYPSPYSGMGNDPVNGIDPDGGFDWYYDRSTGEAVYLEGVTGAQEGMDWLGPDNASAAFLRNGLSFLSDNGLNSMMDMITVSPSNSNLVKNGIIDYTMGAANTFTYLASSIISPILNQATVIANEGFHQGKAYNAENNSKYANIYEYNLDDPTWLPQPKKHITEFRGVSDTKESVYHVIDLATYVIPGVPGASRGANLILGEVASEVVMQTTESMLNYHEH